MAASAPRWVEFLAERTGPVIIVARPLGLIAKGLVPRQVTTVVMRAVTNVNLAVDHGLIKLDGSVEADACNGQSQLTDCAGPKVKLCGWPLCDLGRTDDARFGPHLPYGWLLPWSTVTFRTACGPKPTLENNRLVFP